MYSSSGNKPKLFSSFTHESFYYAGLLVMAFFVFLRFWRIDLPNEVVFDEVYYPLFAHQWLAGGTFYDVHPPLGKLIIAMGQWLVGDKLGANVVGWRIMPALLGSSLIPATYFTAKQIFDNRGTAFIAALLVAIDGMFLVYSRTGLMDIFIVFFGVVSVGLSWKFRRDYLKNKFAYQWLFLATVFSTMAMDIKWSGASFPFLAGVVALITIIEGRKQRHPIVNLFFLLLLFIIIPVVVYLLPFVAMPYPDGFWAGFTDWHRQALDYNFTLEATHPYASKWWTWPLLVKPVWFFYKNMNGMVVGINGIGNPLTWWAGTVTIIGSVYIVVKYALRRGLNQNISATVLLLSKDSVIALVFLISGWTACFLPWAGIKRILYLYHYMPAHFFALLSLAFWIHYAWQQPKWKKFAILFVSLAVLLSIFFIPVWIGYPMPEAMFRLWIWFETWT